MEHINWLGLFLYAVVIGIGVGLAMAIWSLLRFGIEWLVNVIRDRIDNDTPEPTQYLAGFRITDIDKDQPAVAFSDVRPLTKEEMIKDMQDEIREDPDMYAIIWNKLMITENKVVDVGDIYDRFHPGKESNEPETEDGDSVEPVSGDDGDSQLDHPDLEGARTDDGGDQETESRQ